jgi:transposase-like protein
MSNEKKSYSREFKAKVVLETMSGETITPHKVAEKYEITTEDILKWSNEMDLSAENLEKLSSAVEGYTVEAPEEVDLEYEEDLFGQEVSFGATYDILNMKMLTFWTAFGTGLVLLIILALMAVYHFSTSSTIREVSERSEYYDITLLKQREQEQLSSFGVVDLENEIYRIPIDSVITRMARGQQTGSLSD